MKIAFLAAMFIVLAASSASFGQEAKACTTPTTMAFNAFPEQRLDIAPSVHRQLTAIGRLAKANGCTLQVTCVSPGDASDEAKTTRRRQCSAAAQALVRYETRPNVRTALQAAIVVSRIAEKPGFVAGNVYVTLK